MRAAFAVAALLLLLSAAACEPASLTKADARSFTGEALRAVGLREVKVHRPVGTCAVGGRAGWRTRADTAKGEVQLCVSRRELRALSVTDDGPAGKPLLDDQQFARLDRYRGHIPGRRLVPAVLGTATLLGTVIAWTAHAWREEHAQP